MTTGPTALRADQIPNVEVAGVLPMATNIVTIVSQAALVTGGKELAELVPWLSIVAAPLSVYMITQNIQSQAKLARVSKKVNDFVFWVMRAIDTLGNGVVSMLKPVIGTLTLAGIKASKTANFVFQTVLPYALFVTSAIGVVVDSWELGRAVRDYTQFRREVTVDNVRAFLGKDRDKIEEARFTEMFKRYPQCYSNMNNEQLLQAMKEAGRFTIYEHTNGVISAIFCIAAASLFMFGSHHHLLAASLIISSASLGIIAIIAKNILIRRSEQIVSG